MDRKNIFVDIKANSKEKYRVALIELFKAEKAGERFNYFVENTTLGKIYLEHPSPLNKGFDFKVCIEEKIFHNNRLKNSPKHDDLINDLNLKREYNKEKYDELIKPLINNIYKCNPVSFLDSYDFLGLPVDVCIKLLKWLFIEQDITYWNYSGREKLYLYLKEINLA